MRGEQGEGRGPKDDGAKDKLKDESGKKTDSETLAAQSTQGVHFMFDNADIVRVLSEPTENKDFFTEKNMKKVQGLLSRFLDCASIQAKRSFLDHLPKEDFELLVRAYFQLVDNTILAHTDIRH
jgi:hypothetical protein